MLFSTLLVGALVGIASALPKARNGVDDSCEFGNDLIAFIARDDGTADAGAYCASFIGTTTTSVLTATATKQVFDVVITYSTDPAITITNDFVTKTKYKETTTTMPDVVVPTTAVTTITSLEAHGYLKRSSVDDGDEEAIQPDWLPFPVKPASLSKLCTCVLGGRIPAKATEYVTGAMTTVTATSHFTTITLQAPRSIVMATGTTTLTTTTHTVHEVPTTTLTETVSTTTVVVQPAPTFCGEVGHFAVDPMSTDNIYRHANVNEYDCLDICRLNNGCRCAVWSAGSDVYHLPKQCVLYNEYCEELYSAEDLGYIELNGRPAFWSKDCKH